MTRKLTIPWTKFTSPFLRMISSIIKKVAKEVASLNKLSPSNIIANLLGAPKSLKSAKTATGSVAEINEPKRSRNIKGSSKPINGRIRNNIPAIRNVESRNPKIERVNIDTLFCQNFLKSILKADSKIKVGRNIKKSNSEVNLNSDRKLKNPNLDRGIKATPAISNKTV